MDATYAVLPAMANANRTGLSPVHLVLKFFTDDIFNRLSRIVNRHTNRFVECANPLQSSELCQATMLKQAFTVENGTYPSEHLALPFENASYLRFVILMVIAVPGINPVGSGAYYRDEAETKKIRCNMRYYSAIQDLLGSGRKKRR